MSDELFDTRLWFYSGHGIAKLHGCIVKLIKAPVLRGLEVDELDYCPDTGTAEIQPVRCARRDMTRDEIWCCDALLLSLCPR